jgi:hypothetical protein
MFKYFLSLFFTFFIVTTFASGLDIYEKPEDGAKVMTTIKEGERVIPIFYTEKKDWVKVANPKNGDVGWAKANALQGPVVVTNISDSTVQQQIVVGKEKEPRVYSVVQYSGPREMKPEEAKKMIKEYEERQQAVHASMQRMQEEMQQIMQNMFKDFDDAMFNFPVIRPALVLDNKDISKDKEGSKDKNVKKDWNKK